LFSAEMSGVLMLAGESQSMTKSKRVVMENLSTSWSFVVSFTLYNRFSNSV